ncbi:hypothetical protein DPMN_146553 [Dreissena polymorpha]|uniref:Uncharacterized protein n=1 Tax=Dreissena polymorpha TaxID=45954 RepID=A0A9D4F845_DREPO|nr:hypothetical protein DPMN_146553 [Dreissena polymorpha]
MIVSDVATVMDFCTLGILGLAPPCTGIVSPFLSGVSFINSICYMLCRWETPVRRSGI